MSPADETTLASLLRTIEDTLIQTIPQTVKRLAITEPVYAVVIAYMDLTTDEYTPFFLVAPEKLRREWLQREGQTEGSWMIWFPPHLVERVRETTTEGPQLREHCHACYEILSRNLDSGDELNVALLPFRTMMYRVCLALNRLSWSDFLNVTDDFVVSTSDWTGYRFGDDSRASIPSAKRELLESRKLFFYVDPHDPWNIANSRYEDFKKGNRQSLDAEYQFWIEQLKHLLAGDPGYVKSVSTFALISLQCLKELGPEVPVEILRLAARFADKDVGRESLHSSGSSTECAFAEIFRTVEDMGRADPVVEALLREILEKSARANVGQKLWSGVPISSARTLSQLFNRYPEPQLGSDLAVLNVDELLSVPIPMDS